MWNYGWGVCAGHGCKDLEVEVIMNTDVNNGRSIAATLAEMKIELLDFLDTRIELLKTELQEKLKILKSPLRSAPWEHCYWERPTCYALWRW